MLNIIILWLFIYIWYDIIETWNPFLWFLVIIFGTIAWFIWKYNYFLLLLSTIYFFFDYTLNYSLKKEEIQKKVNKRLQEKDNMDIIRYLV